MNKDNQYSRFTKEDRMSLLRAVLIYRKGDDSKFDEIYKLTRKYLWPTALHNATHIAVYNSDQKVVDQDFAEDMFVETMEIVWKKLRTELRKSDKYCAWVKTILNNKFKNSYAKRGREIYPSQCKDEEELGWNTVVTSIFRAEDEISHCENRMMLAAGMEQLSTDQQRAIVSSYILGFKGKEIAKKNHIPEGTVKSRKKNGMDKLRKILS